MDISSEWKMQSGKLIRVFDFPTFLEAIAFINGIAGIAERLQHHPEIFNMYTRVTITLSTHDAGDVVTDKDWAVASQIDAL